VTRNDDMLCDMASHKPSALDRYIEEMEQDDSMERTIERIRARNQRIRRRLGIPERDYPPIDVGRKRRSLA
jgi:hypothetical protein